MKEKIRERAMAWVKAGLPCKYRYGYAFRGAGARAIPNEEAKEMLLKSWMNNGRRYYLWTFDMGFYEVRWEDNPETGEEYLMFNEYSENELY